MLFRKITGITREPFISQTSTVHATLEDKTNRQISIETGRFLKDGQHREYFIDPALFSRHSGHEYFGVELGFAARA